MNIPQSLELTTDRLKLRIVSKEDIPFVYSATKHPGFNDGMLWEPPESEDALLAHLEASLTAWNAQRSFSFTIEDLATGAFLGRITIRQTDHDKVYNIGFWTHPESQSKGIMTEAVAKILEFGFNRLNAQTIEACHALWNKASEAVLKKNGMTFSRYIEQGFQKNGKWIDENLLAISAKDWQDHQSGI
jgi:ribosomal-protein-alanine N-acetyltransferase